MDARETASTKIGIGTGRLLGQLLFFSVSNRTLRSPAVFPILQKNQFAALAHVVLVRCGAESCFCYGVLPGFYSCCVCNKAFAVPVFEKPFKSTGCGFIGNFGRERGGIRYLMPR